MENIFTTNLSNVKETNFEKYFNENISDEIYLFDLAKNEANLGNIKNTYKCLRQIININQANSTLSIFVFLRIKKSQNLLKIEDVLIFFEYLKNCDKINDIPETHSCIRILNNTILKFHTVKSKTIKLLEYDKINQKINVNELPHNFSFVDENLAGSGIVKLRHIDMLKTLNFTKIITLIETNHDTEFIQKCNMNNISVHHFPINDRQSPDFETLQDILKIILDNENKKTLIHCLGGIGRTNVVLSCYLIIKQKISPSEAMTILNRQRKIILTDSQNIFVKRYYGIINTPKNALKIKKISLPGLIMMIGTPCSGKTTLSLELITHYDNLIHINQDELGRISCENVFNLKAKSNNLILDRCNSTKSERKIWINSYKQLSNLKICAIFFDIPLDVCKKRAENRLNHPTLSGVGSHKIIEDISNKLEKPESSEGFDEIIVVKDNDSLVLAKNKFGFGFVIDCDTVMKFPRTKHLINLGSMTKDDILFNQSDINDMLSFDLLVEEKIDGANLGIFYDYDSCKILAQNRSHFVNSSYHSQFKPLDKWIYDNSTDLMKIFNSGNYIIFGEWMYLKHSIHYTKLPDYFIAYDIYNRTDNEFLSKSEMVKLLENTSIKIIKTIFTGKSSIENLKLLVNTQSEYYDGPVEGIYVRTFNNDKKTVKYRGKIVRHDFICGDVDGNINHWTKGKHTVNLCIKYFYQ